MKKVTFARLLDKKFTVYTVSDDGSIRKYDNASIKHETCCNFLVNGEGLFFTFDNSRMSKSNLQIDKDGHIEKGYRRALFLDKKEAVTLATKLATNTFEQKMEKIKNID